MKVDVMAGAKKSKSIEVSEDFLGQAFNETLVHQVVVAYMAGSRQGSKAQKTRSDVSGGGAKPWRQKGTGRARAGTIRSPIWRTGGRAFAARPRDYSQKVNRKMYQGALRAIWSELNRQGRLKVVESFSVKEPKTKLLLAELKQHGVEKALIVTESVDTNLYLAARNVAGVGVCDVPATNPVDLIQYEQVLVTEAALKQVEERLS